MAGRWRSEGKVFWFALQLRPNRIQICPKGLSVTLEQQTTRAPLFHANEDVGWKMEFCQLMPCDNEMKFTLVASGKNIEIWNGWSNTGAWKIELNALIDVLDFWAAAGWRPLHETNFFFVFKNSIPTLLNAQFKEENLNEKRPVDKRKKIF